MKYLLNGLGVAAAIALAAPVSAQVPTTPRPPAEAVSVQIADATMQRPARARPQRPTRAPAAARAPRGRAIMASSPTDNVANDLNRQELQRLQVDPGAPMMAPPPGAPGPRTSGGGYIPPSPAGPVPPSAAPPGAPRPSGGGYIPAPTGPMPMPPPPPISHPVR